MFRVIRILSDPVPLSPDPYLSDLCHNGQRAQAPLMEPVSTLVSLSLTKLMSALNWSELFRIGLRAGAGAAGKDLWSHLKPGEQKKVAGFIARFFVEEFYKELQSKIDLTAALPAYEEALKSFLRSNLPDLVSLFENPSSVPDMSSLERTWGAAGLYVLPTGFDWAGIAQRVTDNLTRALQTDEKLRPLLELSVHQASAEKLGEILKVATRQTGPAVGFDVAGYKQYLMAKSNNLQLSMIHHSTYAYETQVDVWSIFVAQSARASAPAPRVSWTDGTATFRNARPWNSRESASSFWRM
jgi:hypothetical protein